MARALIVCICGLESSEASALRSQLHDMIDALSRFSSHVQEFDLAMTLDMIVVVAYHVRFWTGEKKCNSVFLIFFFLFCAMFSPLVASHFICDFLAFEQGLFCPM